MRLSNPQVGIFYQVSALLYAGVIFYLSSIPQASLPSRLPFPDYVLHTIEYIPFGFLVFCGVGSAALQKKSLSWILLICVALIALYGASDEFHQHFVLGRTMDIHDFIADLFGGLCGMMFARFLHRTSLKN